MYVLLCKYVCSKQFMQFSLSLAPDLVINPNSYSEVPNKRVGKIDEQGGKDE